ncbi:MAG: isochorismate synthase [Marivirga sp.]|nr:isochorismate synthase [Marivirga sp.]
MGTTTSVSTATLSETEYLSSLISYAVDNNFSVAVWRLPSDEKRHLILSRKHELINQDTQLEDLPTGFIFAPFDKTADRIFLKADFSFSFSKNSLDAPVNPLEISSSTWLHTQLHAKKSAASFYGSRSYQPSTMVKNDFIDLVAQGVNEIEKGTFEKIVLSRAETINLPADFDVVHAFEKLCEINPNALISFVSSPQSGTWLGATPELLVSVEDKTIFKTIALAGTQQYHEGINLKTVAWTQKDIEEQALVERYIISCFKKIRLREYDEHGPKTVVAGNVLHLKSEFKVDMQATNFPQLGSVMLQLLHPTSAVCGVPLDSSIEFLQNNEGYQRQFYSGYLGPVNFNNDIHIFVNLRCTQLLDNKAILYAGAGITIDSVPDQEWEETEMKMKTLLKVISQA